MNNIFKGIGLILLVLVIGFIATAIPAFILTLVLNAIGVKWGFWICFGIVLIFNIIIGVLKR